MFDFLTMEQSLGRCLDSYTYAEASQMYAEHGREAWQHTSTQIAYLVVLNTADEHKRKAISPRDFNPWEWTKEGVKKGVKLTRENLSLLKGFVGGPRRPIRP